MHELSLHILDLVQNSLEAGAQTIWLGIVEDAEADKLTIRITDDGKGMDEATVSRATDPFVTGRTTRKVGLGLPLIQMTATQCGGHLSIASKPGQGTTVEAVYQLSHWDRPPLGNVADTIKTIIVANPGITFYYLHRVGHKAFFVSTQELKEILGDIPFSHPEVLAWLDNYLKENTANLYGGVQP
ncbi:MAG: ATP-binding protein [Negativicutes bacterium]|nr:ATP-binding protein [Negativicutes bacterium]